MFLFVFLTLLISVQSQIIYDTSPFNLLSYQTWNGQMKGGNYTEVLSSTFLLYSTIGLIMQYDIQIGMSPNPVSAFPFCHVEVLLMAASSYVPYQCDRTTPPNNNYILTNCHQPYPVSNYVRLCTLNYYGSPRDIHCKGVTYPGPVLVTGSNFDIVLVSLCDSFISGYPTLDLTYSFLMQPQFIPVNIPGSALAGGTLSVSLGFNAPTNPVYVNVVNIVQIDDVDFIHNATLTAVQQNTIQLTEQLENLGNLLLVSQFNASSLPALHNFLTTKYGIPLNQPYNALTPTILSTLQGEQTTFTNIQNAITGGNANETALLGVTINAINTVANIVSSELSVSQAELSVSQSSLSNLSAIINQLISINTNLVNTLTLQTNNIPNIKNDLDTIALLSATNLPFLNSIKSDLDAIDTSTGNTAVYSNDIFYLLQNVVNFATKSINVDVINSVPIATNTTILNPIQIVGVIDANITSFHIQPYYSTSYLNGPPQQFYYDFDNYYTHELRDKYSVLLETHSKTKFKSPKQNKTI